MKLETKEGLKNEKEELVSLLLREIPNLFDSYPGDSLNRGAVERLAEKIINV